MVQQLACGDMVSQKPISLKDEIEQNNGEDVQIGCGEYPKIPLKWTLLLSDSGGFLSHVAFGAQTVQLLSPGHSEHYSFKGKFLLRCVDAYSSNSMS